jgi:hypothetical protein
VTEHKSAPLAVGRSPLLFRVTALLFAVLLSLHCVWLLGAELIRPGVDRMPTDIGSAAAAAKQREAVSRAALIGAIRGELWAQAAFTYADLLWGQEEGGDNKDLVGTVSRATANLDRALHDSPHLSDAWLFLAGLGSRFPALGFNVTEVLKMSYYTGPSEQHLMPLRLRIAAHSGKFNDIEMRQFVSRDIRFLLSQKQTSTILGAYTVASPAGRTFIEQTVKDIDPSALDAFRAGAERQSIFD